ncbi:hypothetical protein ACA910_002665 [Epithemia clementina (nom. ined.)]
MEKIEEETILNLELMEDCNLFSVDNDDSSQFSTEEFDKNCQTRECVCKKQKLDDAPRNDGHSPTEDQKTALLMSSFVSSLGASCNNPMGAKDDNLNAEDIISGLEHKVSSLQKELDRLHKNLSYYKSKNQKLRQTLSTMESKRTDQISEVASRDSIKISMIECIQEDLNFLSMMASYCITGVLEPFLRRSCKRLTGILWDENVLGGQLFNSFVS